MAWLCPPMHWMYCMHWMYWLAAHCLGTKHSPPHPPCRVCSLSCWENYVLLERYVMYAQGCEFLMAPTQDIGPVWAAHMKSIAREGRVSQWPAASMDGLLDPCPRAPRANTYLLFSGRQWLASLSVISR